LQLEFCQWMNTHPKQCQFILFIDKAQFSHDGVNNIVIQVYSQK